MQTTSTQISPDEVGPAFILKEGDAHHAQHGAIRAVEQIRQSNVLRDKSMQMTSAHKAPCGLGCTYVAREIFLLREDLLVRVELRRELRLKRCCKRVVTLDATSPSRRNDMSTDIC